MTKPHAERAVEMSLYADIGRRIKERRLSKRVRQEELASRVGLSRTSVTNIEAGRQKLLIHTLSAIATTLNVPIAELLPVEPQKVPLEERLPKNLRTTERKWINKIVQETIKA